MRDRSNAGGGTHVMASVFSAAVVASTSMAASDTARHHAAQGDLAQRILKDERMDEVVRMGRDLLASGMSAGGHYREVWIRDLNTFIHPLLDVTPRASVREALLVFFYFQGADGNIPDGYVSKERGTERYTYRFVASKPVLKAHKNTVETDQESSLVQAVCRYIRTTKDVTMLEEVVRGISVRNRLEMALDYPLRHRFSKPHGLIWGATTADWGDVQPEHEWGVELDENTHRAIDIYDNALFLVAMDEYLDVVCPGDAVLTERWTGHRERLRKAVRSQLWDGTAMKFVPHIYLDGSPFPESFDETRVFYHGGTAVAMEAGLLSRPEIVASYRQMRRNIEQSGAASLGLTLYPAYPEGAFMNPSMAPYSYQNGGDWTWFGARAVRQLAANGFVAEAYLELEPMLDRVLEHDGFYEWWTLQNHPRGSGSFRGSAGVLIEAIHALRQWSRQVSPPPSPED